MSDAGQWFRRDEAGDIDAYKCASCDAWHEGLPLSWHTEGPAQLGAVPEDAWDERVTLTTDQCILEQDGTHFFMRGLLRIPVHGRDDVLEFGVWASLSEANFERAGELWETQGREAEPPYSGWLSTAIPGYPDTMLLQVRMHTRPVGERPQVEVLAPEEHPLRIDQRDGISEARLMELVAASLGLLPS